jgi:hypothetical protein
MRVAPLAILLLLAACGPAATATNSPGPVATATATATTTASSSASASATLPTGFPVMPGSEAVAPMPDDDPQLLARWTSAANGAQVYDFFVEALPAAGLVVDQLAPGGEAAIISFSTSDGSQFTVSLIAQGSGTRIDLLTDAASD